MENNLSPQTIFEESSPFVDLEITKIKGMLLKGIRYIPVNHGLIFRVKKIFENAGWKVKKVNGYDNLEFSCENDDEEFLTKI